MLKRPAFAICVFMASMLCQARDYQYEVNGAYAHLDNDRRNTGAFHSGAGL